MQTVRTLGRAPTGAHRAPITQRRVNVRICATPSATTQVTKPVPADDPWKRLVELEQSGDVVEVEVKRFNKGGLIVKLGAVEGFIPYKQMGPSSIRKGHSGNLSYLVGQKLQARVISVDMQSPKKEVVLSEKRAVQTAQLKRVNPGSVMRGVVRGLEEYGVFVELVDVPGLTGMVHKSEVSWDPLAVIDTGLQRGQVIAVKVLDVDPVKCRLSLSIKQLTQDPLKATLDTLEWGPTGAVPPEVQRLVDRLGQQPAVEGVMVLRQAREVHHVAQELQVFLTRGADTGDGHVVVARLGPVLQELQVLTSLDREAFKGVLQAAVSSAASASA